MQPKLMEALGQPIVIENRGGASGTGRLQVVARQRNRGDQPDDDAPQLPPHAGPTPVSLLATGPLALVAHQSAPWKSFNSATSS
jgi:tripartite-type tricarboxylate transporter receptor subunit TctC